MERDNRRAAGQWRGCYAFDNVTSDGTTAQTPSRSGGLKMASEYFYYVCLFLSMAWKPKLTRYSMNLMMEARSTTQPFHLLLRALPFRVNQ